MSYLAYINGHQLELSETSIIAYTKQVNDLARLDNRQSNFTHKFTVPFTANNKRAMEFVYFVGNQSNIPYQKNTFDLIDIDNGNNLIYKGWANIQPSKKGYEINVYDGIIDFYRRIENKTLTDIDVSDLDHSKNLTTIINSWQNNLPYIYAVADYNGNNRFTTGNVNVDVNTDYQVPSARVSYIWDRIFAYAGFTYAGSYFQTEDFLNLFMTFPKPVPTLVPLVELVTQQTSQIDCQYIQQPDFSYIYLCNANLLPTPYGPLTAGSYRIKVEGLLYASYNGGPSAPAPLITYYASSGNGQLNSELGESVIVSVDAGTSINIQAPFYASSGSVVTTIERILGYDANFSEALVDFKATDFVNEIIQQAGITAFKDKYTNHIEFLTMNEILYSNNIIDWSNKFQYKDIEKYRVGKYAKRNNFTYRYNSENETHNDGYITINDENLDDETDVINSKIYTPEKDKTYLVNKYVDVFKIWEKEPQDDSTIKYKELSGRYYFLRFETISASITIASKLLNQEQAVTQLAMATYARLKFTEIINNNYSSIISILDKAKMIDGYFYLTPIDVQNFDFKSLIYVEQLASYYLVNKIMNFIKGKVTKCELLEVDYKKENEQPFVPFVTITNTEVNGCNLIITFDTNIVLPANLYINGIRSYLVLPNPATDYYDSNQIVTTNQITITVPMGGAWSFTLTIGDTTSSPVVINNTGVCDYTPPIQLCVPSSVVINNVQHFQAGYPSPGSNGSYWVIGVTLNGVTNNDGSLFSTCMPYSVRVEKRVNGVLETINIPASYLFAGAFYFNTADYPSSATFKVIFISPNGIEYQSNIYNF